jgi:mannose-6-phosphate isomerase
MATLYPLKFMPRLKEKIWGGNKIETILKHKIRPLRNCGESWEISGLLGEESVVTNGFLADNNLNELMEIYLTDLVGEKNYDKYGLGFPLLIKFIDAQTNLSVQVHPDDTLAQELYGQNGKTEMWHVIQADEGAGLYIGFNQKVTENQYLNAVEEGTLESLLKFHPVKAGDTFMIPAGTVHAIGKGVLLAEIQQPSDITFRIFDWNRVDENGMPRELHTEEALHAIHFEENVGDFQAQYTPEMNKTVTLVHSPYFNANLIIMDMQVQKSFLQLDSFVIYICLEGSAILTTDSKKELIEKGEVVLIPAEMEQLQIIPNVKTRLIEVYCS